ncbi:MAG: MBL fold metallo-hydrolase [Chloroflexi bacterium]|nr:MBL fold metallo-hydrolase [Chloroflexota bacterium]
MRVKWLGHACFLITSDDGLRVITDPYTPGGPIRYGNIGEAADVVTVSHKHGDHDNVGAIGGRPEIVDAPGLRKVKGIDFRGIATYHDEVGGRQRGPNVVVCFTLDGIRVCHLGDLGHQLDSVSIAEIGKVEILFVPVGGLYTIDALVAAKVCESLNPRVVMPMHYKNAKCGYPIAGVDEFLRGRTNTRRLDVSETEFKRNALPSVMETFVLTHAL